MKLPHSNLSSYLSRPLVSHVCSLYENLDYVFKMEPLENVSGQGLFATEVVSGC